MKYVLLPICGFSIGGDRMTSDLREERRDVLYSFQLTE